MLQQKQIRNELSVEAIIRQRSLDGKILAISEELESYHLHPFM
jgi:hypothetical protein